MKKIVLLALLVPAMASAQAWSQAQVNGLIHSLNDAVATINDTTKVAIDAQGLVTFGVSQPTGTPYIDCTIRLQNADRLWLGIPDGTIAEPADLYAVMRVAGPAFANGGVALPMPVWMSELVQTCSQTVRTLTGPWPSVTLAARTNPIAQAAATGFACACRGAGTCNWTPPLVGGGFGASTPAPKSMTIPAGLWSGAGCSLKVCVEVYGSDSMPNVCK